MQGEAAYGGNFGFAYRLRLTVTVISQDTTNNRTLINLSADMRETTAGYEAFNNSTTYGTITYDGNNYSTSLAPYDFRGSLAGPYYFVPDNNRYWIYHNPDGTRTVNFQAYHNAANSPYVTTATVSFNYTLPPITPPTPQPTYANITGFIASDITDSNFKINISTDAVCDLLELSTNGGSSFYTEYSGDFTSLSRLVGINLPSGTTYPMVARVRRKDSQLKTTSGVLNVTTLTQNNFMGFL